MFPDINFTATQMKKTDYLHCNLATVSQMEPPYLFQNCVAWLAHVDTESLNSKILTDPEVLFLMISSLFCFIVEIEHGFKDFNGKTIKAKNVLRILGVKCRSHLIPRTPF